MIVRNEYRILSNDKFNNKDVYHMTIDCGWVAVEPGQFVNVMVPGVFLPRPISIANYEAGLLHLVYRVVGEGTKIMSEMIAENKITIMTGLGNGFDLNVPTKKPLIIGGGLGVAPLHYLVMRLKAKGLDPTILLGFRTKEDTFYISKLESEFSKIKLALDENNVLVTDLLRELSIDDYDYFYACGPKPMLKAVSDMSLTDGELSLEERMACGIGQCKCCSIETNEGMKTLCNDGPVLKKSLVRWCAHD